MRIKILRKYKFILNLDIFLSLFIVGSAFLIFNKGISLFSTKYALGMDGYYYASQIHSFWSKGRFFSPDSSVVLYAMTYFSLLGDDIVLMNKIFVLVLYFLFMLSGYTLGSRVNRQSSLFLGLWFGASFLSIRFSYEYIKNYGALVFLLFFVSYFVKTEKSKKDQYLMVLFLILGVLSHKLVAVIAGLILILDVIYKFRFQIKNMIFYFVSPQVKLQYIVLSVIIAVLIIIVYNYFPNFIHITDSERITREFSFIPQFPPLSWLQWKDFSFSSISEVSLHFMMLFFALFKFNNENFSRGPEINYRMILVALVILCISWFPFFKFTSMDLAYRFFLLSFLPPSILMAALSVSQKQYPLFITTVLAFGLIVYGWNNNKQIFTEEKYALNYNLIEKVVYNIDLPENALMIVHQGFDYYYCYTIHKDAFHFLSEKKHIGRPIYRMAYGVTEKEYKEYLGEEAKKIQILPGFYSLMEEDIWQKFRMKLPMKERSFYDTWRNPFKEREEFLKRNDAFKKE